MDSRNLRLALAPFAALFLLVASLVPAKAMDIKEVRSPGGVTAWLVEDYTVPIITIRFAFKGGSTQDPAGKEGIANLLTGLFDEGAGDLDSDAFQLRLDDVGLEMSFSAGRDAIYGSARMLASARAEALPLLELALTKPRFDAAPIERIRSQVLSGIEARARDPETAAQVAWSQALYGNHPYARRDEGTPESLASIKAADLKVFHGRMFGQDNLVVGVVGAIDAAELGQVLDRLFGNLPGKADLVPVAQAETKLGQEIRIEYDLPQTRIQLAYPGLKRNDPAFFAAYLMNHVLGGGTFSSRLFREVREVRGLAYSVGSSLVNNEYSEGLVIATATRSDRAAESLGIIRAEVARMAKDGPTPEELADAKKYIVGAYAIANLTSSSAIANTLVGIQMDNLGIDYIDRRAALIDGVTLEQARDAARRLLTADPAVMILGPAANGG